MADIASRAEQAAPEEARTIKIAMVQSMEGKITVCGPDEGHDYSSPMEAALCWSLEASGTPANRYWITVRVPPPSLTEIDLDAEFAEVARSIESRTEGE